MTSLRHVFIIAIKDLRLFAGDRTAVLFSLLFPFMFVALFTTILSAFGSEDARLELHVTTNEDQGSLSHLLMRSIQTDDVDELDPGEPLIIWERDYHEALAAVQNGTLAGILAFPDGFSEGISRGYGTHIAVVTDSDEIYLQAALTSVAETIAHQLGLRQILRACVTSLVMEAWLEPPIDASRITAELPDYLALQAGAPMKSSLIEYVVEETGPVAATEPTDYVVPGYLVMFVFMAAASSAEAIVHERRNHTFERLLTTSVRRESIIVGTFLGTIAMNAVQITVFWTAGILIFNARMGHHPGAVILLSLLMAFMSSAFAVMLAAFARTERSAASIATVVSLVFAALGGCWWPLFITPRWMQFLARATPHGWATTGFNKLILFGAEPIAAAPEMAAVTAFGIVFAIIALFRFRASAN